MLENVHGRRRRYNNLGTTLHPPDEILAFVEMFIYASFISLEPVSHKSRN